MVLLHCIAMHTSLFKAAGLLPFRLVASTGRPVIASACGPVACTALCILSACPAMHMPPVIVWPTRLALHPKCCTKCCTKLTQFAICTCFTRSATSASNCSVLPMQRSALQHPLVRHLAMLALCHCLLSIQRACSVLWQPALQAQDTLPSLSFPAVCSSS